MNETEDRQSEKEIWPPPILDSNEAIPQPDLSKETAFGWLSLASPLVLITLSIGSFILSLLFEWYSMPAWEQTLNDWGGTLAQHAKLIMAMFEFSGLFFGILGRKSSVGKFGLMTNLVFLPLIVLMEL